ncbi:AAA family ATPase [Psychrobacter sp. Ps1]|uniref:KAP family P-loop NTPase fold protein n=1 Tax=Psychrobacter sp. Ps1 TaxID=2790955 RepID=UPI001EDDF768|nr:P-loop NTPase fold protein [Psychrobacter sp. Ps1]MCG3841826.1 AAA family ATPase [Psychrobacter sp. Ps1]
MTDYSVMKELTFSSRDEFTRKPIAEKIIKLLDSDIDVSPLIIDGKWGTGKTEFCFKLKNLIEANNTNNYKVGYVNAFQADHANEPLLTLIAEVAGFYDKNDDRRKSFIKNAIPYLRLVSGIGIKAIASLAFGKYAADIPDDFQEGMEAIEDGSDSFIDQSLESMIKDQVEAEKNLSTLREALKNIAAINPVILLIDELDRCRPDFAVMMLETIKHVFDVDNVQIILITNAEQLKATIKHSYGSETDSHSYLYKFFKYQINLPTTIKDVEGRSIENNVTYFKATVQASRVIPQDFKDNEFIYEIPTFLDVGTLSLRNIEQIVRCIETLVVFENIERSKSLTIEQILMVFLSFVYMMDRDLLNQIITRHINPTKFSNFVRGTRLDMRQPYSRSDILNDLSVKNLFSIAFDKYFVNSFLDLPSSTIEQQEVQRHIKISLGKYDYISDIHNDEYIKQIINNLLLFDIVK